MARGNRDRDGVEVSKGGGNGDICNTVKTKEGGEGEREEEEEEGERGGQREEERKEMGSHKHII